MVQQSLDVHAVDVVRADHGDSAKWIELGLTRERCPGITKSLVSHLHLDRTYLVVQLFSNPDQVILKEF